MASTAEYDPVTVEPALTDQKIAELVARGSESAKLDYKREVSGDRARVELVKDVLAMANSAGGYIVVGVDDEGRPVGISDEAAKSLDEAGLQQLVASHTQVPVTLFATTNVRHENQRLAIITVLPLADRLALASRDGQSTAQGRTEAVFRRGEVFVRHGSASERWGQDDADYLTQRIALARKQAWYADFARDLRGVIAAVGGPAASPDVSEAAYDLPAEEFRVLTDDLLEGPDG